MEGKTRNALLLGAGFLIGTVGVKALTSDAAKRVYVQGVAKGLQAKSCYEGIVEQAKAEVDDIVAEATYLSATKDAGAAEGAGAAGAAEGATGAVEVDSGKTA